MDNGTRSSSVHDRPWMDRALSSDERATLLLAQMTLEEKVDMLSETLDPNATSLPLSYWNVDANGWEIASADYRVYVGASSRDTRLTGSLHVYVAEKKKEVR